MVLWFEAVSLGEPERRRGHRSLEAAAGLKAGDLIAGLDGPPQQCAHHAVSAATGRGTFGEPVGLFDPYRPGGQLPVGHGRLQDAELVSVRVSEDVPAPACLGDRRAGQWHCSQRNDTFDLGLKAGSAEIQVEPVLSALRLGHPLQQDLDSMAIGGNQTLVAPAGRTFRGIAEHAGPEPRRAVQIAAVDHDNEMPAHVGLGSMVHCLILAADEAGVSGMFTESACSCRA
jgi:hypothetical protein